MYVCLEKKCIGSGNEVLQLEPTALMAPLHQGSWVSDAISRVKSPQNVETSRKELTMTIMILKIYLKKKKNNKQKKHHKMESFHTAG